MLSPNRFLGINPLYKLRNDRCCVTAYLLSTQRLKYHLLSAESAIVVALMNGQRSAQEMVALLKEISPQNTQEEIWAFIDGTISSITENSLKEDPPFFLEADRPLTECRDYDPCQFLIQEEGGESILRPPLPIQLSVMISGECQSHCRYCYSDLSNLRNHSFLSKEEWMKIFRHAKEDCGIELIYTTGGDPMAHPEATDIWAYATQLGFLFSISTKCFISQTMAKKIGESGFTQKINGVAEREFQISLDTYDDQVNEFLVGVKNYSIRAKASIKNLLQSHIIPSVKSVLTSYNKDQIELLAKQLEQLGIKTLKVSLYKPSFYRDHQNLSLTPHELNSFFDQLETIQQHLTSLRIEWDEERPFNRPFSSETLSQDEQLSLFLNRKGCAMGRGSLGVSPHGLASLCEQMEQSASFFMGDLTQESIQDIWNSEKLQELLFPSQELFKGTACEKCSIFTQCVHHKGHCIRDNYFYLKNIYQPMKECPFHGQVSADNGNYNLPDFLRDTSDDTPRQYRM